MDIPEIEPDYYLCLNEGRGQPRACSIKGRRQYGDRGDCMLVAIEPPVLGEGYGLGGKDIKHLLLASRMRGQTLWPVSQWPMHVYVLRFMGKSVLDQATVEIGQAQLIECGVLHPTFEEAAEAHELCQKK